MWIRLSKYIEVTGESRSTLLRLRHKGSIIHGYHYRTDPMDRLWINTERMAEWVEGKQPSYLKESQTTAA
jgi:hypothetical protein